VRKECEMQMTVVNLNGVQLYYERCGSGIPFLVMHGGLGLDHSYFRPGLDLLGDFFELYYYDHRGHGRSGPAPIETITYETLADDAEKLRKKLGYEKIGIIGHSAGGCVALHYAIRHPDHIRYLILLDTSPIFDYPAEIMENIARKKPTPEILKALNAPSAKTAEEFQEQFRAYLPIYFHNFNSEMQEKAQHIVENTIFTHEILNHQDSLMEKYNVCPYLKEIQTPTLILVGEDDAICPPSQANRMRKEITNSEIYVFPKCGHFPFLEKPKDFMAVIQTWIDKIENKP
jgi:proline iminopeptidase